MPGESADDVYGVRSSELLDGLRDEDPRVRRVGRAVLSRPPYETAARACDLPRALSRRRGRRRSAPVQVGMSFWTDAAILGEAGIPSVLFGPGGAGLHSLEEYVRVDDVILCRDALASLAIDWP